MTPNVTITISRQLGSGGSYVGKHVADRLHIKYVDREILRKLSAYLQEDEKVLSGREERVSGFWERVMQTFCYGVPEAGYLPPPLRTIPDEDFFAAEAKIIREVTGDCSAVIVGRAGFHILKGRPNLVKVLLHAPREFRVQRIMKIYSIPDRESAEAILDNSDRQRAKFVKTVTGLDWMDASSFNVCVDTEAAGFTGTTEIILRLVENILHTSSAKGEKAKR